MRIVKINREEGEAVLEPQCLEDLWYLNKIVAKGDIIKGVSFRRFKSPSGDGKGESGEKKKVHLEILAEQIEFAEAANKLRVTGKILAGSPEEFAPKGAFHTIDLEMHERFTLRKKFTAYDYALLDEAKMSSRQAKATIIVMDEHKANLADLSASGLKFLFELTNHANKRQPAEYEEQVKAFFSEITKALELKERVIVAGSGFMKDDYQKYLKNKNPTLLKKASFEYASSAEKSAVYELMKQGVVERLLGEQKLSQDTQLMEELKKHIAKEDGYAAYGLKDVEKALEANAVDKLIVTDELARKDKRVMQLMEDTKSRGASLVIFDVEGQPGLELKAFGLAALLRYSLK